MMQWYLIWYNEYEGFNDKKCLAIYTYQTSSLGNSRESKN